MLLLCFSLFNFALANISLLVLFCIVFSFHIPLIEWKFQLFIYLIINSAQLVLDNFAHMYKHTHTYTRALAIAHMPRSMRIVAVAAAATTNIHMCSIINSKFKWGNFTHFTQCELAVTGLCDSQRLKKQRKKNTSTHTTVRSASNRRKNLQQSKWITQNTSISY